MNVKRLVPPALVLAVAASLSFGVMNSRADDAATAPAAQSPSAHPLIGERIEKIKEFFKSLDLSEDQKTQLKAILQPFREKMKTFRDAHKDELEKLRTDIKAAREANDKEKLKADLQQLKTLMADAPKIKDLIPQIEAILNPDQLEKFKAKLEEVKDRIHDRAQNAKP